jgi:DNA-binding PadR family transcriptional regulator
MVSTMPSEPIELEPYLRELRRGSVLLACLLVLEDPGYGYGLLERLEGMGVEVDANTLYPMLRRLEEQGLLTSVWDTEGARPRKYYATSAAGSDLAAALMSAWRDMNRALEELDRGDS